MGSSQSTLLLPRCPAVDAHVQSPSAVAPTAVCSRPRSQVAEAEQQHQYTQRVLALLHRAAGLPDVAQSDLTRLAPAETWNLLMQAILAAQPVASSSSSSSSPSQDPLQALSAATLATLHSSISHAIEKPLAQGIHSNVMTKHATSLLVSVLLTLCVATPSVVQAANNKYPIVLVHGLGGWGRDEFLGIRYWGVFQGDFQEKLKAQGHDVYTVGIGKVSSDWDRACELYAQIKGGTVDYGVNHAGAHNHKRFGRTYPGVLPQWGEVVDGHVVKVHLIGHSMGGTTIRLLTQLLNHGTEGAPVGEDPTTHPLFEGGKDWVHSITGMSAPFQGSTLANFLYNGLDLIELVIGSVFGITGLLGDSTNSIYDAHLDQWGISPKAAGETVDAYLKRIATSSLLAPGATDNAGVSLATGVKTEENKWVKTLPHVYHYTFVTDGSVLAKDIIFRTIAVPNLLIVNPIVAPLVTLLGSRETSRLGFGDNWLANDGFVPVQAQLGDGVAKVVPWAGKSEPGTWVRFDTLRMDHLGLMGANPLIKVYNIYEAHAQLLANLPMTTSSQRQLRGGVARTAAIHEAPEEIVRSVQEAHLPYQ